MAFDWLVGIVGAVGFRLLIYFKSKNAKKFRRDEEFGSARWGGPKDIAPVSYTHLEALLFLEKQLTKGRKSDIIKHVAEKR